MKKKYTYLIIILLTVVLLVAFGRITGNEFINFDDTAYITENNYVQSGINPQTIKWAFTAVVSSNWHPVTTLSHILDFSLFGANASGHHLVSLFLHIGAVIFLFLFLNKTTNNIWPAAFAAAFFAFHPLRVESVAWASERKDVLSMFLGMASLYAYSFYADIPKLSKYILCLVLFILALMSKPMMVTLPFVLMLLDYWPLKRWQKAISVSTESRCKLVGKLVWGKAPFFLLTIVSCIITFRAQTKEVVIASAESLPLATRIANAIVSYATYLEKTFWPVDLAIFYPYKFNMPPEKFLISGLILIVITIAVIYCIKKLPFLFVGWFWYLGTLIPVIGLVQIGRQATADRYTYLPSVGIAVMLSWGLPLLLRRKDIRAKVLFPSAIAILFILAVLTWKQCGYWKNSIVIFSHALTVTKNNYLAHDNLGLAFFEKGESNKALDHYNKAIIMEPRHDNAYNNRGVVYLKHGLYRQALDDFNKTIALNPAFIKAYNNRGMLYAYLGNNQLAIKDFSDAIKSKEDYAIAYKNRGIVYLLQGNYEQGCRDAQKACEFGICKLLEEVRGKEYCH